MKLTVRQRRSLAELFEDAERTVELYWDTENGQELSRSLEAARMAFTGLERIPRPCERKDSPPRLIIEAQCAVCGPLFDQQVEGLLPVRRALRHSSIVGHVVILNGTTDLPEELKDAPTVGAMT
jgi:hypothetical protein